MDTRRSSGWKPVNIPSDYSGRRTVCEAVFGRGGLHYRILELDHIVPRFKDGLSILENVQTLCNSCNASKGTRTYGEASSGSKKYLRRFECPSKRGDHYEQTVSSVLSR